MRYPGIACILALVVVAARPGGAQRYSADDEPLLSRLAAANPCPATIPVAWVRTDSALGRLPLCAVVAASVTRLAASPDSMARWTGSHAVCIDVVGFSAQEMTTGRNEPVRSSWAISFMADTLHVAHVTIARPSGEMSAWRDDRPASAPLRRRCGSGV